MVRAFADGSLVSAKMEPGANGFQVAVFGEEPPIPTEMPNLVLALQKDVTLRKPAAAKKFKGTPSRYSLLWYKNTLAVGLRQKFGEKKQIVSFRCALKSKVELMAIGKEAIAKLDHGETEAQVTKWCKDQCH